MEGQDQPQDQTIFRQSIPAGGGTAETSKPDPISREPSDVLIGKSEMPINLYEESGRAPYLVDYLGMEKIYGTWNTEAEVKMINDFILSEIKEQNWKVTPESFQDIMKGIEETLKISPHLDIYKRLDKLVAYVKLVNRQKKIDKQRERLYDIPRHLSISPRYGR